MNWMTLVLMLVLGALIGLLIANRRLTKKNVVRLGEEEFAANMRKGQLIDMRPAAEFEKGYINGARNIPSPILVKNTGKIRKDQPVYLYDAKGKNSTTINYLKSKGIEEIYYLDGGLEKWTQPLRTKNK